MSPERNRLLNANFTLIDVYPTLLFFYLYSSLTSPVASTNQRALLINQSTPSTSQSALACFNVIVSYKYHDIYSLNSFLRDS